VLLLLQVRLAGTRRSLGAFKKAAVVRWGMAQSNLAAAQARHGWTLCMREEEYSTSRYETMTARLKLKMGSKQVKGRIIELISVSS
jgi:hypothetical protein